MNRFLRFFLLTLSLMLGVVSSLHAAERVRMHCDRSLYAAGETVWLRAWVMEEAEDAAAAPTSKFLYVELLRDGVGGVEKRVKLKERSGMFFGQLELPEDLESGWYTLRAYTRAQKDWPAEALFHTRLLIRGAGAIPGLYSASAKETPEDQGVTIADASGDAIRATLSQDADGHLSVSVTDAEGHPVAGNFALSVVPGRYGDYDYQAAQPDHSATATASARLAEGPREYTQDLEFRVKCVRNRLPDQYHVAIMSQDIGYYYSTDVPGDRAIKGEEGQSFRIPDLDFPEETLFSVNVTGSKFLFPADEPEVFAEPFDYGPTYPVHDEIRDTAVISRRLEGLATPPADADTITAAQISAERKPAFYRPERMVGPFSTVFEWRQVKLRDELQKYDDMDLMAYISSKFNGLFVTSSVDGLSTGREMYTNRSGSVTQRVTVSHGEAKYINTVSFSPVDLYINGVKQPDWDEAASLTVSNVQNLYVLRGTEAALYKAAAVVLLELRRFDEKLLEEQRKNERKNTIGLLPLGYQIPKAFPADAVDELPSGAARGDAHPNGTLYWNPCIRTDAQGHASISLPAHSDGCYIRLVGQTLDGRWFSAICE